MSARRRAWGHARPRGFTLVEVLVVLAILVILFGLLFAPMMAGMDMATQGRVSSRLQDVARTTAEEVRRDLVNAMYVYPPPSYLVNAGAAAVTDYSEIVFVPADTDDTTGEVVTPRRPRTFTSGGQTEHEVVRYWVKPPDLSSGAAYDDNNPFVLMRQEGLYRWDATLNRYVFGSVDPADGLFYAGRAKSENSMTPREDYDIPATTTINLNTGTMTVGYAAPTAGETMVYLHDDVKFQPERIVGEAVAARENNTVYEARHGNWMGTPNNGVAPITAVVPQTDSELQPRIVLYRWAGSAYTTISLDTYSSVPAQHKLRWNSATGTVRVGDWHTAQIHVDPGAAPGANSFWPLDIDGDSYNSAGALSGSQTAAVAPIYPKTPTEWGEPRMPIAYSIDPGRSDGLNLAAKVVPGSVRVTVVATGATEARRAQYTPVQEVNQSELGVFEFSEFMPQSQLWGETRFNRYEPPSPDQFADPATGVVNLTSFDIYISYYYRRNFDDDTLGAKEYRDDVLYADYSTGEVINITIIPQRYIELQPYKDGATNLVVPPDMPVGGVPVRTQAVLLNAKR